MKKVLFAIVLVCFVRLWYASMQTPDSISDIGIECGTEQMLNWQCKMKTYKFLWIRKSDQENTSVWVFLQDTIGWVTMFIWTVVTVAMIISGLLFVFSGADSSLKEKAKKWLINSIIWMLIVFVSYTIIRIVQYLVKWWS